MLSTEAMPEAVEGSPEMLTGARWSCKADVGLEVRRPAERRQCLLVLGWISSLVSPLEHGHQHKAVSPAGSARGRWPRHLLSPAGAGGPAATFSAGEAVGISHPARCMRPYSCPRAKSSCGSRRTQGRGKCRCGKSLCGWETLQTHCSICPAVPSLPAGCRELPLSALIYI